MPSAIAIVSQKGGVGKTTTAVNLAAALARRGVMTLLIDADPQGAVRYGLGLLAPNERAGVSDYLSGAANFRDVVRPTVLPWLRAISAGSITDAPDHEEFQRDLAKSPRMEQLLRDASNAGYAAVIDTPPGLGPVTRRVLQLVQHVIVPLQCEPLALQTTAQVLRGVRSVVDENPELSFDGVVLTMLDESNPASTKVAEHVRTSLPAELVAPVAIPRSSAAVEAFAAGQPLVARAPDDAASRAYLALAQSLEAKLR